MRTIKITVHWHWLRSQSCIICVHCVGGGACKVTALVGCSHSQPSSAHTIPLHHPHHHQYYKQPGLITPSHHSPYTIPSSSYTITSYFDHFHHYAMMQYSIISYLEIASLVESVRRSEESDFPEEHVLIVEELDSEALHGVLC